MAPDLSVSASQQIEWLRTGEISAAALLETYIARYRAENPKLNAVIAVDLGAARGRAAALDILHDEGGSAGPLHGLPMTIKDVYDVNGLPAVCGAPEYAKRAGRVENAELVKRLKSAGAVIWGKTNTPYMASDVQTYNKVYGVSHNPHDLSRTPGGSSGGAAAALASAMTALEVGSDIAGSLRTPAHFCGVCALKPSYGLVPLKGHVPPKPGSDEPAPDLAVAGPMARNVADLELLLSVLAPDYARGAQLPDTLSTCRIAVWSQDKTFRLDRDCTNAVALTAETAQKAGASVAHEKPDIESQHLIDIFQRLLMPIITAEMPSVTHRAMRLGSLIAQLGARKGEISLSNTIVSATQTRAQIKQAQGQRDVMKAACAKFFETWDVLITPVTPVPAIVHNNRKSIYSRKIDIDGTATSYTALFDWIALAAACHLPAAVIPVNQTSGGLPVGVQIIGANGTDAKVLRIAALLEAALAG